jgi:hypothetical protein
MMATGIIVRRLPGFARIPTRRKRFCCSFAAQIGYLKRTGMVAMTGTGQE